MVTFFQIVAFILQTEFEKGVISRWNFSLTDKHRANGSVSGLPAWRWCTGFCGWQTGWGLPSACSCFDRGPWANGLNVWTESPRSLLPTRPAFLPAKHKNTESSEDKPHRPEQQRRSADHELMALWQKSTKTNFNIPHLNKAMKQKKLLDYGKNNSLSIYYSWIKNKYLDLINTAPWYHFKHKCRRPPWTGKGLLFRVSLSSCVALVSDPIVTGTSHRCELLRDSNVYSSPKASCHLRFLYIKQ